jgi:hypothetical protein
MDKIMRANKIKSKVNCDNDLVPEAVFSIISRLINHKTLQSVSLDISQDNILNNFEALALPNFRKLKFNNEEKMEIEKTWMMKNQSC